MHIKLGGKRGGHAIVSPEDYDELSKYKWWMDDLGYVAGKFNRKNIRMHRYIMEANEGDIIDHINGIRHDNRRENLRFSTTIKNAQNSKKQENTSSKYKGVYYNKSQKKFIGGLTNNGVRIYVGRYDNEVSAAEAVDMYWVHHPNNEHIKLNFSEKRNEYLKRNYTPANSKRINQNKYKGITKRKNYYEAYIRIKRKDIYIGSSKDLVICAKMRDKYIIDNEIPNRILNFPQDYPAYDGTRIKTKYVFIDKNTIKLVNDALKNKKVLIDYEDYDKIKNYAWHISRGYVHAYVNGKIERISRYLLNVTDRYVYVDHINGDTLDNTKSNLRLSDSTKNGRNKKKKEGTKSKYLGLSPTSTSWESGIMYNSCHYYIGSDISEEYAARRRDLYIIENYPDEQYKMNFQWDDIDIVKWSLVLEKKLYSHGEIIREINVYIQDLLSQEDFEAITIAMKLLKCETQINKEGILL